MTIKELNVSMNVIAFILIMFGGILSIWEPEVGKSIILLAGGAFGGSIVARSAQRSTDQSTTNVVPATAGKGNL